MANIKGNKHYNIETKQNVVRFFELHGYSKTIEKFGVSRSSINTWVKAANSTGLKNTQSGRKKVEFNNLPRPFNIISKMTPEEKKIAIEYFTQLGKL